MKLKVLRVYFLIIVLCVPLIKAQANFTFGQETDYSSTVNQGGHIIGHFVNDSQQVSRVYFKYRIWGGFNGQCVTGEYIHLTNADGSVIYGNVNIGGGTSVIPNFNAPQLATGSADLSALPIPPYAQVYVRTYSQCNEGGVDAKYYVSASGGADEPVMYGYLTSQEPTYPFVNDTRFITVQPYRNSTVATSTTISATVYIRPDEYQSGMSVYVSFQNASNEAVSMLNAYESARDALRSFEFEITQSGTSTVSATFEFIDTGLTSGFYALRKPNTYTNLPLIGGFFNSTNIISTTTQFTVVTKSEYDLLIQTTGDSVICFLSPIGCDATGSTSGLTGTSTNQRFSCNSEKWSIVDCIGALLVPDGALLYQDLVSIRDTIFKAAPLGYLTRIYTIMVASTSATLPNPSYTFPSDFPVVSLRSQEFGFHIWDSFFSEDAPLTTQLVSNTDDPKNVWEILSPVWNLVIYGYLALMIFSDLLGITTDSATGFATRQNRRDESSDIGKRNRIENRRSKSKYL